ncbi:MAG TPA: glycosyltransferase [Ancylobacter sp.]
MLRKWSDVRGLLVQSGLIFYRRYLKYNYVGRLLGSQILRHGLIKTSELHSPTFWFETPAKESAFPKTDLTQVEAEFSRPGFHLSPPLNIVASDALAARPTINVLIPSLKRAHMSGGPNTALILAALLAERGERIRLIACDAPTGGEEAELYAHMDGLMRRPVLRSMIELVDGFDRSRPVEIGADDIFLATAWWTAQIAKYGMAHTLHSSFIYLIQDFEPILHEGSTFQARALETYGLNHIPVINTRLLLDHLLNEEAGCYADPDFARGALWFEPALDRKFYFPALSAPSDVPASGKVKKKVLLFYARPSVARRNLFELGLVALRHAVASGNLDKDNWEVWAMGEQLSPIGLGNGVFLNPLPWMNFSDYAERVRTADLLLSLMLSPHPSYPPLEMAASGKLVVTNSFSVKTLERLKAISPNLLVAEPNSESIASTLGVAIGRVNAGLASNDPSGSIALPLDWDMSLKDVVETLVVRVRDLRTTPANTSRPLAVGFPAMPRSDYEHFRRSALVRRRGDGEYKQESGLLSFVTSVYNTAPHFLDELASSIFQQDGGMRFEWLILDNGSADAATIAKLREIGGHAGVKLHRVEENLGIVGGMRFCLERASGRYIMPLDSDDLVEPDCVNVISRFIRENDYPPVMYTDEDKIEGDRFLSPYLKPDWDPALFLHSCYIAHLCVIDRTLALSLDLYSNKAAEGCHDWDSFIRLTNAGYVPLHIPEVLYSWRMHSNSTSANISSKSYITASHSATLPLALNFRNAPNLVLETSPLFKHNVDWWFRRKRSVPVSCASASIDGERRHPGANKKPDVYADRGDGMQQLADRISVLSETFVHLAWSGIIPDTDEWLWDSAGLLEMFPDAVMVGGTLHDNGRVVDGPRIFGFGLGCDCPDRGRLLTDPGYSANIWKAHSVSAVSSGHCVVRRDFLVRMMPLLLEEDVPVRMIGPWLGALAAELGMRILFSPFMSAKTPVAPEDNASEDARASFLSRFWSQIPDARYYSPRLGLTLDKAYSPVSTEARAKHLRNLQQRTLPYAKWLARELKFRALRYPAPSAPASITIITPVYQGSDLGLLDELARAISSQTMAVSKWLLIVNGPMPEGAMASIRSTAAGEWRAQVIVEVAAIGIVAALRLGLEAADTDYVVPVDADDLITGDAIQILAHEIDRKGRPDFLFSDEDMLVGGAPTAPYLRAAYDPVLSLDNSTIWHLCAMKRDAAIAAGVYSDAGANWCQDWDSVSRMIGSGGRLEHIPEVLYHWRHHAGSTTNKAEGDARSLDSVRHILERHIARCANPQLLEVSDWPESRGARELYIARRPEKLPTFVWIGDVLSALAQPCNDSAILVVAGNGIFIDRQDVFVEVARLFELHPKVGVVGGNVVDPDNIVVDGCYMKGPTGAFESPWIGRSAVDGGPFAMALKTQTVTITGEALAFFRVSALRQSGLWPPDGRLGCTGQVWRLCDGLSVHGWTAAFSPLVRARAGTQAASAGIPRARSPGKNTAALAFVRYGRSRNFVL